ncbi:MAG: CpaF family protein [Bdellovibrionota bacterium]
MALPPMFTTCYDDFMEKVSLNFGPLLPMVQDDTISEIMVNQFDKVYVEKAGKLTLTPIKFPSESSLIELIQGIAQSTGRSITAERPAMDSYLPDGSRINAVLPPMAPKGAVLTIRKFRKSPFTMHDYIKGGTLTDKAAYFLHACLISRLNIIVSGGTGTGKTTFLNALSGLIPETERVITIEDVAELNLQHPNWVRLESVYQPGKAGVTTRDCLINALRMRPDRIVVGECRRDETFEMLQAMNTGHDGSMTTIHANSSRDCLIRMESLIMTSSVEIPLQALRRQMASAVQIIVQLKRLKSGQRVIQEIVEVTGLEQNTITTHALFSREKKKGNAELEQLLATGLVPHFADRFHEAGVQFPPNFFDPATQITYQPD